MIPEGNPLTTWGVFSCACPLHRAAQPSSHAGSNALFRRTARASFALVPNARVDFFCEFFLEHQPSSPQEGAASSVRWQISIAANLKRPGVFSQVSFCRCEQIRKTQDEPQWIVTQRLLSHLQYLDSVKSSAKDLSHPQFEIMIRHITFNGNYDSYATGSRPNICHVTMEVVDNTA